MFLFSYLNFMHIGKVIYFKNLQNTVFSCACCNNVSIQICMVIFIATFFIENIFESENDEFKWNAESYTNRKY